uniref:long-chain-fatty-acid--CoA ligase n=1 Tax=Hirondellea gigas TaxID=1518452 RepID=A0A2P2I9Z4_9CRUS
MVTVRATRGEDGCWRKVESIGYEKGKELVKKLTDASILTIPGILKYSVEINGDIPCMGTRTIILRKYEMVNGKRFEKMELGDYAWSTYNDVYRDVLLVSQGVTSLGLKAKDKIAVFAETRADWYTLCVGCLSASLTVVTLYTNLHDDGVIHGIRETEVDTIVTSHDLLPRTLKMLPKCEKVRNVVVFGDQLNGIGDVQSAPESVKVLSYGELKKLGESQDTKDIKSPEPDDVAIIMYTSGSTGTPKGVQLTHRNIFCAICSYVSQAHIAPGDCYLAYLPLAHVMELGTETALLAMGISIAYSSPHTLTNHSPKIMKGTLGDAQVARPTILSAVPLILDRIIKGVTTNVERQGKLKAKLFSESLRYKQGVNGNGGIIARMLDAVIFNKVKDELGGRLRMMVVGGAPLSMRTHNMIRAMFGCSLQTGYGLTETSACATSMDVEDCRPEHVGAPNPGSVIKLESWEEGGYRVTDEPHPRGEIIVGGDCVALGYYKLPEENALAFFEKDGMRWFRTGDIGEFDEYGCLHIIDRKKDLIKLQHGEYVSLGHVESTLKTHALVDNLCVFADSSENNTVAVCVPSGLYIKKILLTIPNAESLSYEDGCAHPDVVKAVLKELQVHGRKQKLNRTEIPAALFLSSKAWTPDNGLVTAALKIRRKQLALEYANEIAQMYAPDSSDTK